MSLESVSFRAFRATQLSCVPLTHDPCPPLRPLSEKLSRERVAEIRAMRAAQKRQSIQAPDEDVAAQQKSFLTADEITTRNIIARERLLRTRETVLQSKRKVCRRGGWLWWGLFSLGGSCFFVRHILWREGFGMLCFSCCLGMAWIHKLYVQTYWLY